MAELRPVSGTCDVCGSKIKGKSHAESKKVHCPSCDAAVVLRPSEALPAERAVRASSPNVQSHDSRKTARRPANEDRSRHEIDGGELDSESPRANRGPVPVLLVGVAIGLLAGVPVGWLVGGRSKPAVADAAKPGPVESRGSEGSDGSKLVESVAPAPNGGESNPIAPKLNSNPFKSNGGGTAKEPEPEPSAPPKPNGDNPNSLVYDRSRGVANYSPKLDVAPEKDEEPILILFQTERGGPDLDAAIAAAHYVGDISFTYSPTMNCSSSSGAVFRNRVHQGTVTVYYVGKRGVTIDGQRFAIPLAVSSGKVEAAIGAKRTVGGNFVFTRFLSPIATLGADKPRTLPSVPITPKASEMKPSTPSGPGGPSPPPSSPNPNAGPGLGAPIGSLPKPKSSLARDSLVGKWLMSDGVIEFQTDGTFLNLGDKHKWELENGAIVFTFSGKKSRATGTVADGRLTYAYDSDPGSPYHALRLDPKTMAPGQAWAAADMVGEWTKGDDISFKIDPGALKGFCSSKIAQAGTNLANFEYANISFATVDGIRLAKIQGAYWVVQLVDDRKTLQLIAADATAFKPSSISLKRK